MFCEEVKKEYRDEDVEQQLYTRKYLEAMSREQREWDDTTKSFLRQYNTISSVLYEKHHIDQFTRSMWFLDAMPEKLRKKVTRSLKCDWDNPEEVVWADLIKTATNLVTQKEKEDRLWKSRKLPADLDEVAEQYKRLNQPEFKRHHEGGETKRETAAVINKQQETIDELSSKFDALALAVQAASQHRPTVPRMAPASYANYTAAGVGAAAAGYGPAVDPARDVCRYCLDPSHRRQRCDIYLRHENEGLVHFDHVHKKLRFGRPEEQQPFVPLRWGEAQNKYIEERLQHGPKVEGSPMNPESNTRRTVLQRPNGSEHQTAAVPVSTVHTSYVRFAIDPTSVGSSWSTDEEDGEDELEEVGVNSAFAETLTRAKKRAMEEQRLPVAKTRRAGNYVAEEVFDSKKAGPQIQDLSDSDMKDVEEIVVSAPAPIRSKAAKSVSSRRIKPTAQAKVLENVVAKILDMPVEGLTMKDIFLINDKSVKTLESIVGERQKKLVGFEEAVEARVSALRHSSTEEPVSEPLYEEIREDDIVAASVLKTQVKINNRRMTAVLDSGSEINLISLQLAKDLRLPLERFSSISMIAVTGERQACVAIVRSLPIAIGDLTTRSPFIVFQGPEPNLLLGRPWQLKARFGSKTDNEGNVTGHIFSEDRTRIINFGVSNVDTSDNRLCSEFGFYDPLN
ncbi:hypothetical protein AJ80_10057 [Polytolypa hystricis UAMH7299]|uniref:Peptidase A2 domain-containing protein n=1 Tax=Polytolypa hystricis (strain UAMH7299) TaxID=1447883 RepID=A0A2B7WEI3_POLH7|nr:hypothetical protein AJ80_10057 [Polytolypa hystricis UAMH7299]